MKWVLVYILFSVVTGEPRLMGKIYADYDVCAARQEKVWTKHPDLVMIAPCYPIDPEARK